MRKKEELPELYKDMEMLLEHGDDRKDIESVANCCDEIVCDHEMETAAWFLGSKAYLAMNKPADALLNIETAIKIDPSHLDFYFHLFNVLIQLNRDIEIAGLLNVAFPRIAPIDHAKFIGFVEKCLETGIVHKMQLSVDLASAIILQRNRAE